MGFLKKCLLAFCVVYVLEAVVLSMMIGTAVRKSNADFGAQNPYENMVSDEIYERMCYRNGYPLSMEDGSAAGEKELLLGPVAFHWFIAGKAVYLYSYEVYDAEGEMAGGSWRILVTISYSLSPQGFVITDYDEPI